MKIIDVNVKCGVCEKESEQQVYLSRSKFNCTTHLDLRCDDGIIDMPLQVCPHCHYVNFNIGEKINLTTSDIEMENEKLRGLDEECRKYILTGWVNERIGNKKEVTGAYLFASWRLEDLNDLKNAEVYRRKVCDMLVEQAMVEEDGEKIMQCVDLYRKNGEFHDAYKLLELLESSLDEQVSSDESFKDDEQYKTIEKFIKFEKTKCSLEDRKDYLLDDIYKKMDFVEFYCLFLRRSQFENTECSIYAPIIYNMKEEYFDAAVESLNTRKCKKISFNQFNTKDIVDGYGLENNEKSYLKALIILNNIENNEKDAYIIFNPYTVE